MNDSDQDRRQCTGGRGDGRQFAALPERQGEFKESVGTALRYARSCGCKRLHAMAGIAEPTDAATLSTYRANLAYAAEVAARDEVTVLIEPINRRDMPDYFYSTVEEGAAVVDAVGAPNVKLMFDAYHVGVAQGDVIMRLRKFYPKVGHVQIAAVPSRAEPDEGEIHFPAIFKVLEEEFGYAGWIGAEYKPRASTDAGMGWVQAIGLKGLGE